MQAVKLISKIVVLLSALGWVASGCDVVKSPIIKKDSTVGDSCQAVTYSYTQERKVLLEDYTGFLCGNCPEASREGERLKGIYGDKLVIVKVHAGVLAEPAGGHNEDYRTQIGNELDSYFNVSDNGVPKGIINRTPWNGNIMLNRGGWAAAVDSALKLPVEAYLKVYPQFDINTRTANVQVEVEYLKPGRTTDQLALYIIENNVEGFQKDYKNTPQDIYGYKHKEMLRGSMNATWGNALSPTAAPAAGTRICKRYSYQIPNDWNPANCNIVAILHNNANKNVLQVEEKHLVVD